MRSRKFPLGLLAAAVVALAVLGTANYVVAQQFQVLYSFLGGDGSAPYGTLIQDSAGNLYGTTFEGGPHGTPGCNFYGCGVVFEVNSAGRETALFSFVGRTDGIEPIGGLVRDPQGNLYGTAPYGGDMSCDPPYGCGVVFEIEAGGHEKVLHTFENQLDGREPQAGLVRDAAGNLYGMTSLGGSGNCGTVFKVDEDGILTQLYRFGVRSGDGCLPIGAPILDAQGNLYGTTEIGGLRGCTQGTCGTVFKLAPNGQETVLYSFTGGADGGEPMSTLVGDSEGGFYGTTTYGGDLSCNPPYGCGVVFKVDTSGTETVLHTFVGGTADGWNPTSGVARDSAGNLYGTTYYGGEYGYGTVYKVNASGQEGLLYDFAGCSDGGEPYAGVILDKAGNLYGTNLIGGYNSLGHCVGDRAKMPLYPKDLACEGGCGVVFKITP